MGRAQKRVMPKFGQYLEKKFGRLVRSCLGGFFGVISIGLNKVAKSARGTADLPCLGLEINRVWVGAQPDEHLAWVPLWVRSNQT